MAWLYLSVVFILVPELKGFGQNLVSNPSFEEVIEANCQWSDVSIPFGSCVASWDSPNKASPDMHSLLVAETCWAYAVNSQYADSNPCQPGSQQPRTGNVMAGFITTKDSTDWREYIRNRLVEPNIPGKRYRVRFYVSLADNSAISSNNIGVFFSENDYESESTGPLNYAPQIEVKDIIENDIDWIEIDTVIVADGSWRLMTIGNFRTNAETETNVHQYCPWAYYYIDDVSVMLAENQTIIPNVFTPNGDGINDTFRPYLVEPVLISAKIYDRWGRLTYASTNANIDWDGKNRTNTDASPGVYFYVISYTDAFSQHHEVKGHLSLIR